MQEGHRKITFYVEYPLSNISICDRLIYVYQGLFGEGVWAFHDLNFMSSKLYFLPSFVSVF